MTAEGFPRNALFVCFGCMSNVGMLTGLAGLEVLQGLPEGEAGIFCLSGLATEAPLVMKKTGLAERIIAVDGCALNCALKILEAAGFSPDVRINLVEDCGIKKGKPFTQSEDELDIAVSAIREALG